MSSPRHQDGTLGYHGCDRYPSEAGCPRCAKHGAVWALQQAMGHLRRLGPPGESLRLRLRDIEREVGRLPEEGGAA